jgi:predicted HD superfamily hydrolase involved in NAD metabolism
MELEQIRDSMKMILKPSRYLHSKGVEEVACDLAAIYGYDMEKACIAGMLHDCAKNLTDPELLLECKNFGITVTEVEKECMLLLHAKVGALHARIKYGVEDEEILSAITYHTTGRPAMSMLEKIIFTADYIEPYRKPLPRIDEIRRTAYTELDIGIYMILENMLDYLNASSAVIDSLTVDTYKYYKAVLKTQY